MVDLDITIPVSILPGGNAHKQREVILPILTVLTSFVPGK
jgi:hypothetical protein